jgi:zinc protease
MINFEKFELDNGLKVIVHEDQSTPLAAVNIVYNVGARDEDPDKTGFAHLFEHLMFGGSVNIPNYDEPLQRAGGENNAFTNNDITNYYITLPSHNLETAFWLESDRMLNLAFTEKSLEVQRNVVIEEFKERYLNQPYGDVWLALRPLAYKEHPYKWATIGKDISHIENATLEDVKAFFLKFYCPNNAILVVAGNVQLKEVKQLCEKWFSPIPSGPGQQKNLPAEPEQTERRFLKMESEVPIDALYMAFHCCSRVDKAYYVTEIISDILSRGKSARLFKALVKKRQIFSELDAYTTGDADKGLFVIEGKLVKGVEIEAAEKAIWEELGHLKNEEIPAEELLKVKNKLEAIRQFSEMSVLNKAMGLAFAELMGDASLVNEEIHLFTAVSAKDIVDEANVIFRDSNCSVIHYLAK